MPRNPTIREKGSGKDTGISVVTPTLYRAEEVQNLLLNLCEQTLRPLEVILVDGAPEASSDTETIVKTMSPELPFPCRYLRHSGGTAIQRNVGIDNATGEFVAFIDDDVRLEPGFFRVIVDAFRNNGNGEVGGIVGYRINKHFTPNIAKRWQWYRRLHLLQTFEPGRYDYETGYPINVYLQPPFKGVREVDFMTTACAVWRRDVFVDGMRFDPFFRDYGVLEDAHFALRARRKWNLLQCGDAHCRELSSPRARENQRLIGYKVVVNYYYVFKSIVHPLTWRHQMRFWRYQIFELSRMLFSGLRRRRRTDFQHVIGRIKGILAVASGKAYTKQ